jgi:hypothetical protein
VRKFLRRSDLRDKGPLWQDLVKTRMLAVTAAPQGFLAPLGMTEGWHSEGAFFTTEESLDRYLLKTAGWQK